MDLRMGLLAINVGVDSGNGLVGQGPNGAMEIQVRHGARLSVTGTGLASSLNGQIFLLTTGQGAIQLANTLTDGDGAFGSEAIFATSLEDPPIPVGRHTMQIVSLDAQGREAVVELTVNITQPSPAPELDRQQGDIPRLSPGQSLATNAGLPENVGLTALSNQKQARIEGAGWSMAVDLDETNGSIQQPSPGEILLELANNRPITIFGSGFMPSTRADVWLFSEPILLGTVEIDGEGNFSGVATIDDRLVAPGEHTLQLQAIGEDGFVRAVNLGVVVTDLEPAAATSEEAQGLMWPLWVGGAFVFSVSGVLWWWSRRRRNART
jgi:hypothetical protein